MRQVWYFSAAGHSRAAARWLTEQLECPLFEIGKDIPVQLETAAVVFPVYCQNIPEPVRVFLSGLRAKNIALIATYGKMGCGNVLWEGKQLVKGTVIAGACVPTGHTYLDQPPITDYTPLQPVLNRIREPKPAQIPRQKKWWLADLLPELRSSVSVRLEKTDRCTACGLCSRNCPVGTMNNGKPGTGCIRCLRCAAECPAQALQVSYHPVLRFYLRKPRQEEWIFYL